jgi:DNA-binding MarR family transcriptional regulator
VDYAIPANVPDVANPPFSFLTNHGLVLLCVADDPHVRMRDIARIVDITERAAQRIVGDLVAAGYVSRTREGRRNTYTVRTDLPVALPQKRDVDLNSLLHVLLSDAASSERRHLIEPPYRPAPLGAVT